MLVSKYYNNQKKKYNVLYYKKVAYDRVLDCYASYLLSKHTFSSLIVDKYKKTPKKVQWMYNLTSEIFIIFYRQSDSL